MPEIGETGRKQIDDEKTDAKQKNYVNSNYTITKGIYYIK